MGINMENEEMFGQEIMSGPMLHLLRRLEQQDLLIAQLVKRGLIKQEEVDSAYLRSTLNHADRIIRVRERVSKPTEDVRQARETVQRELDRLSETAV